VSAAAGHQAPPRGLEHHARHLHALPGAVQQQAVAQGIATPEQKAAAKRQRRFIVTRRPYYPSMAEITEGLGLGWDVRIMTAQAAPTHHQTPERALAARQAIQDWCRQTFGRALPVTHEKDCKMLWLFVVPEDLAGMLEAV